MQMMMINRSNTVFQVNSRVGRTGNQKTAKFMSQAKSNADPRKIGTSEFQKDIKRTANIGAQKIAKTMAKVKSDTDTRKIGTGEFQQGLKRINATGDQKISETMQNVKSVFKRAATAYQSGGNGPIGNMLDMIG